MNSTPSSVPRPSDLILARVEAFRHGDYGLIFDSYHQNSSFRRHFPSRDEYIRYGWANLGKEFRILGCTIIREEQEGPAARVIYALEFKLHGERQQYAELAWLEYAGERWCYLCGQKLAPMEWPVPVGRLDFDHFAKVIEKVIY